MKDKLSVEELDAIKDRLVTKAMDVAGAVNVVSNVAPMDLIKKFVAELDEYIAAVEAHLPNLNAADRRRQEQNLLQIKKMRLLSRGRMER